MCVWCKKGEVMGVFIQGLESRLASATALFGGLEADPESAFFLAEIQDKV